jgi:hypothetical protein
MLYAGGTFMNAGGGPAYGIARWTGEVWWPLGEGVSGGPVQAMCVWDPDGPGPRASLLVVAGGFTSAGSINVAGIAAWDGAAWSAMGNGLQGGAVFALTLADPDGQGPLLPQLIAAGDFTRSATVGLNRVARWNGAHWQPLADGFDGPVYALAVWGGGAGSADLVAGGSFLHSGGAPLSRIARWNGTAWAPLGSGVDRGSVAAMASWAPDSGMRRLAVGGGIDAAGGRPSAHLALWGVPTPACGTADFDGDGNLGTDSDIEAFFACLAGNCCAACWEGGADFNEDGDVGTDADIESFFRVLAGGHC